MVIAICGGNDQERSKYYKEIVDISKEIELNIDVQVYLDENQLFFEYDRRENIPDIIYLDIEQPERNSINLAFKLRSMGYDGEIIFLMKSSAYWSEAFDLHAFHYLLKDTCTTEKFKAVLKDAAQMVRNKNEDHIFFNNCGTTLAVKVKEIYYFEVSGRIVTVFYSEGKFDFYSTLSKVEEQVIQA